MTTKIRIQGIVAELNDTDGTWRSSDARLDAMLNAYTRHLNGIKGPAYDPDPEFTLANALVKRFDGELVEHDTAPFDPEVVY